MIRKGLFVLLFLAACSSLFPVDLKIGGIYNTSFSPDFKGIYGDAYHGFCLELHPIRFKGGIKLTRFY